MIITLNCGHTLKGGGTGAKGFINEEIETRVIGNKVIELLRKNGHTVYNCTVDYAPTQSYYLSKVVEMVNSYKSDLFISIHFNAFDSVANGIECYTYNNVEHKEALNICKKLSSIGFKNRGVKNGSNLYVVKNTKPKAILIEVCFCDNQKDVTLYKNNKDKIAELIYESITGEVLNMDKCSNVEFEKARQELMKLKITDGTKPQNNVTREQVWTMLYRMLKHIK